MPVTIRHCCLDISGGINNARMWRNCITVDGRLLRTEKEVKAFFREQQAMGRRVLPIGDCDNFDYQTGCQRQFEIVRKRRRNFVVFRLGGR